MTIRWATISRKEQQEVVVRELLRAVLGELSPTL